MTMRIFEQSLPRTASRKWSRPKSRTSTPATSLRVCWNSRASKRRCDTPLTCHGALGSLQTSAQYLDTQRPESQIATAAPATRYGEQIGYSKSTRRSILSVRESWFFRNWAGVASHGPAQFSNQNTPGSQDILGVRLMVCLINSTIGMKFNPRSSPSSSGTQVFNKQPPSLPLPATGGHSRRDLWSTSREFLDAL